MCRRTLRDSLADFLAEKNWLKSGKSNVKFTLKENKFCHDPQTVFIYQTSNSFRDRNSNEYTYASDSDNDKSEYTYTSGSAHDENRIYYIVNY